MKGSTALIIKPLQASHYLLQMEALARRLPTTHTLKDTITSKAKRLRAGYIGEASLEYPLQFLPQQTFLIFYNVRLKNEYDYFQIDILIVSANFILIVEVKNIKDHVIFDEMGQAIRISDHKKEAFTHPMYQINLQHTRFLRWLRQHNLPPVPLEKLVVYTNPKTILKNLTNDEKISDLIIHKEKFLEKLNLFQEKYTKYCLSEDEIVQLSFRLTSSHITKRINVLEKYALKEQELIRGVLCLKCYAAKMYFHYGTWRCNSCYDQSKIAHRYAFSYYALLIEPYINNRQAREFLEISSPYMMKRLFKKENLQSIGSTSGRKYKLEVIRT
ncbi:NERD domain-containing protein [Virgibacillus pantothenticus]|nr:NERD domain-containing protein [Virgibacillus pantothenticus]